GGVGRVAVLRHPTSEDEEPLELAITLEDPDDRVAVFGSGDRHLRIIRDALGVRLYARNDVLKLEGDSVSVGKAASVIDRLQQVARDKGHLVESDVSEALAEQSRPRGPGAELDGLHVYTKGVAIHPKTEGQRHYVDAMT